MNTSFEISRTTAADPWPFTGLGNHRVLLNVPQAAPVVRAVVAWRRRDRHPEKVGVRLFALDGNREIANIMPVRVTRAIGEYLFEAPEAGRYALYFMPFEITGKTWWAPHVRYRRADYPDAVPAWRERAVAARDIPAAEVMEIQARTDMDRFDPMEVIATSDEMDRLRREHADTDFLLFPEDRTRPIRMVEDLPAHWIASGPGASFEGRAQPNEYYTFQIGLYALRPLENVEVEFSELRTPDGQVIPPSGLTCFNLGGTDWLGRPFRKPLTVPAGRVQPLWIGVDLPPTAAGRFTGELKVRAAGVSCRRLTIAIHSVGAPLADRGDGDLWRHARLRWLNTIAGVDNDPTAGYPPVEVSEQAVRCLGRRVAFGPDGLPSSIQSFFTPSVDRLQEAPTEILAAPIAMQAVKAGAAHQAVAWRPCGIRVRQAGAGAADVEAVAEGDGLAMQVRARMEFDGHLDCRVTVTATQACELEDLALLIPLRSDVARYMMGLGCKGGARPAAWTYEWNLDRSNHHAWIGTVNAGLHLKLKHAADVWDLANLKDSGFPEGWYNDGRGGVVVAESGDDQICFRAFCGARKLAAGESVDLRFSLMVTPLKLLDLKGHWQQRYHHIDCWDGRNPDLAEARRAGATVVNLHQGGKLNPYINYPFCHDDALKAEVDAAHAAGLKYKVYYTLREMSHHMAELWALRSLRGEIFPETGTAVIADQFAALEERDDVSGGTGGPWLREHLVGNYVPAWQQILPDGEMDQAIATTGLSRLHNYYLEGVAWLLREIGMDGIYLDGIGYDRQIMKRVRKAMDRARPGGLIDFHSGNNFHPSYGLNNVLSLYMEHLPFVDSLWIGEGFDYHNESPDYFLTEVCGIPFGLTNDMLQGGGHPWRGMLYGMTCRYGWQQGGDPQHIWRLWREFGIAESRMYGYWTPDCPVRTDQAAILATVYAHPEGRALIAIASWADKEIPCRLAIDAAALGIDAARCRLSAPSIPGFQDATEFAIDSAIPVPAGRGWLLVLGEGPR